MTPPADWRLAVALPWLADARGRLAAAARGPRFPHALLVLGMAGLGKGALADWVGRLVLCERPEAAPCGACASCTLHAAGTHPDLARVGLREERKQVAIDDVRELIESLALKSHHGGYKVGIVDPADAMNANGANALLKTLEEPPPKTLLVLVAARLDRLPATIASRCQRLVVPVPDRAAALAWLETVEHRADWPGALALTGGAPLAAAALAAGGGAELLEDMAELPAALARGDADVVAVAERFARHRPAERLRWIENWVTERIRKALAAPVTGHSPSNPGLPPAVRTRHIQALYGILDEARAAQSLLRTPANATLLLESVLSALGAALVEVREARGRS